MSKEIEYVVSVTRKAKDEIKSLRQQLADHIKREVILRDALRHLWNERTPDSLDEAGEALAATADLDEFQSDIQAAAGGLW
jgi:predicted transcriptional regulator